MSSPDSMNISRADIEIIIVDDDKDIRINTSDLLSTEYNKISSYSSPSTVLPKLSLHSPVVILTDLRMPGADGYEFSKQVQKIDPNIPVILMTGYGDVSMAVDAMKQGLHDFIEKPFDTDQFLQTISRAVDKRKLTLSLTRTREELESINSIESKIIGQCPAIRQLKKQIIEHAPMDIPVMIYGDTGVGKELVARSLHDFSKRSEHPFVALNCAAIPEQLAEAELFGYEKGAFTDAVAARVGRLEHANGGTLFLDEVESLPLSTQAKLLRALSDNKITPLGSNKEIPIDCRVISATKDDLRNNDNFRQDLFFRLQVAELRIPALKDRSEDILTLFEYFANQQCENFGTTYTLANSHTRHILLQYDWPGNVRELINVATRYAIKSCRDIESAIELDASDKPSENANKTLKELVGAYEEKMLRAKLAEHKGKVALVLEDLGLERRTFNQKLNRYGISASSYKNND